MRRFPRGLIKKRMMKDKANKDEEESIVKRKKAQFLRIMKKCIDWVDVEYEDHEESYEVQGYSRPPW